MSISGINNSNELTNIFYNPLAQQQQSSISSGNGGGDTVSFSSEAMEMYNAAKAEKQQASATQIGDETTDENSILSNIGDDESLTSQAMEGSKKGGGGKGGKSEEDDDDEESSWYDEWFDTMYGTEDEASDQLLSEFLVENK